MSDTPAIDAINAMARKEKLAGPRIVLHPVADRKKWARNYNRIFRKKKPSCPKK